MFRHIVAVFLFTLCASAQSTDVVPMLRLRSEVQLALIPVHVTTAVGGAVMGLTRANFHLFEDGVEQHITYFVNEDAPLSVGFVLDTSQSMKDKIAKSLEAARAFLRATSPDDEFFLVEFNEHPRVTVNFTRDPELLAERLGHTKPLGRTALLDAIQLSLVQQKKAHNARKAIVILSDGGDNHSRYTEKQVRRIVRESDVQIYAMGIFDPSGGKPTTEEQDGPRLLQSLAEETGGRHFPVEHMDDLGPVCARVGAELRNQYVLGYSPDAHPNDGLYHRVKVEVEAPGGLHELRTQYRPGYIAPSANP